MDRSALLNFRWPKDFRLRKPAEFRKVYAQGKRFDGRLTTAFLLASETGVHRLGITASKKGIGKAYQRNRAKRLLREAFRLSRTELESLNGRYDWVLNARRGLLAVKLEQVLSSLRQTIETIKKSESELAKGEENIKAEAQKRE